MRLAILIVVACLAVACTSEGSSCDGGCPPLAGHAVECSDGVCVARPEGGGPTRHDCNGSGSYEARLDSSASHCGACGNACPFTHRCEGGRCVRCSAPFVECPGAGCVDLRNELVHCGACGQACVGDAVCRDGRCVPCPAGARLCNGRCVDLLSTAENCGACGLHCPSDRICEAGRCVFPCLPGDVRCAPGAESCNHLRLDQGHCGACGRACAADEFCQEGACARCPEPLSTYCRGFPCRNVASDNQNCGACGRACTDTQECQRGVCVPCAPGWARCPFLQTCRDLLSNHNSCGACDRACAPSERCVDGRCEACPAGRLRCAGDADPCGEDSRANRLRCGTCDTVCGEAPSHEAACREGRCEYVCRAGSAECDGDPRTICEAALTHADGHCGACGRACAAGTLCIGGVCAPQPVRPRSPVSATYATSARPWLRWELPAGADGARVEVCATPRCDRVEMTADVTGDRWRPSVALANGAHFWRLFARRGGRVDTAPGPAWEFVVPVTVPPAAVGARAFLDVNGDGFEDRVVPRVVDSGTRSVRGALDVFFGGRSSTTPDQVVAGYSARSSEGGSDYFSDTRVPTAAVALGDVNGDGYGDVLVREGVSFSVRNGPRSRFGTLQGFTVYAGGPRGLASAPLAAATVGNFSDWGVPPPRVDAMAPLGDVDGDGFGDWLVRQSSEISDARTDHVYLGARSRGGYAYASATATRLPVVGDFNADGAADLVRSYRDGDPRTIAGFVLGGARWRESTEPASDGALAPCGAVPALGPSSPLDFSVVDRDADGYDDLRAVVGEPGESVSFLYRGGPDGLNSARCERLP